LNTIKINFDEAFKNWEVKLPVEALTHRNAGEIQKSGWYIQYLFGSDENGEFIDYLAYHRMTNPRHKRIYENGDMKGLPVPMETYSFDPDTPGDQEKAEKEYYEYNRKIGEELEQKGFRT
jgi:hypothetical protein